MRRSEAKEKFPEVFARVVVGMNVDEAIPFFYHCRHFDAETRSCLNYENRPRVCRTYPFADGIVQPSSALPATCAFRADIGLPVAPMPVSIRTRT